MMACGRCKNWRRLPRPKHAAPSWKTEFGRCTVPASKGPYWADLRYPLNGEMVAPQAIATHESHGTDCKVFRP